MNSILTPVAKRKLDDILERMQRDNADAASAEAHGAIRATGGGVNGATLAGDVSGRLSATVVGRILGRLLAATAPVAGQALVYDGTSWVPISIGVGGPTTTYTNWALTAQGATATASSTQSPYAADLTIDGDDSTFWTDAYGNEVANEWVRIDLGAARAIDYFRLYQFPSDTYGATSCKIQSSTNGSTWTDRHTIGGIFTDTGVIALASGLVTARYWRLYGLTGPPVAYSHQWRVNSIELLQSTTISPATAGHVIEDEGTPLTQRAALDFVGTGVAATDGPGDTTTVTVSTAAHDHTATAGDGGVLSNDQHDGYSQYTEIGSDPSTPSTNTLRIYAKDKSGVSTLYYITDDGTIYELPTLGAVASGAPSTASFITLNAESTLLNETVLGSAIGRGLLASRPVAGAEGRLYYATDTQILYRDSGSAWESIEGATSVDELAKVSSNDTTAGYLNGKLVAGANVILTENSDGGDETLEISLSPDASISLTQAHEHVENEDHTAETDGSATTFITAQEFEPESSAVYQAGARLRLGADYTEAAIYDAITLTAAPSSSTALIIDYITA